ncbi:aminotransferase-like domain-containing protein [Alkalihalobacterium chitinilyticum]|uniref:PLP-dependent aminotransferase family protein n=1 Tax=Alkalihalobacterium chitinilyticum TaxID=2980103 RepID=A0ABT5VHI7_9BACI|nr:PLP-dependent aminotransferase family protein [Alkalihalobacterium chitinilyticum]MDE5414925.1 PLP-dependent aminotransferase family protein [Alkalihalobacterium chitinilyticum]
MKYAFAKRVRHLQSSAVRDILKVVSKGNVISFAGGLPDDDLFPLEGIREAFEETFKSGKKSLQYIETEGFLPLRDLLIDRMSRKDITSYHSDEILLTTGSQQAIDLFSRVTFNPGDIILTENPTYLAALQVFESYEAKVVPVESDEHGMIEADLVKKIKKYKPKCIYVVPTFSNPAGKVWSNERRKMVLKLAQKYHVIIFEDDPYGDIQFNKDETYYPIASFDKEGTHVLYTSTFSKTAVPALRTGWIAGPHQIIRIMSQAKQANDLHSNSLSQQALYHLCTNYDLDGHIRNLIEVYHSRMNIMLHELEKANLPGMSYVVPKGGMFFWIELDESIDTTELLKTAVERGVAYVPGAPFYVGKGKKNALRLNYTHSTPEKLETGMKILTDVIKEHTSLKEVVR